jgi:hypothetical protein
MNKFEKASLKSIQNECVAALSAVMAKHGITVKPAGGKFDDARFTAKFDLLIESAAADDSKKKWDDACVFYDLKPSDFGTTFTIGGTTYRLTGINMGRPKFPISAVDMSGRGFKFPKAAILKALKREESVPNFTVTDFVVTK